MIEDFKRLKKETLWRECFAYQDDGSKELDEDKVRAFLDTAFDELLALVERENDTVLRDILAQSHHPEQAWYEALRCARASLRSAFARLRGEDSDKSV